MLELILHVCLILDPDKCKDVHLNFAEDYVSAQSCMFNGQLEIVKWKETHPDWDIKEWKCGEPGKNI